MQQSSASETALRRILEVLSEYAAELILIGGWVPFLHLTYGRGAVPSPRISRTTEADLLVPDPMRRDARRTITEILREAEFHQRGPAGVIWVREPVERGEVIEFMQSLTGPAASRGTPGPVTDQPGLRALKLEHLRIMEDFTEVIRLPPADGLGGLEVRVPTLGAFALNKANSFHLRGGDDSELKAGQDLLYLRDVLAAGLPPTTILEEDLDAVAMNRGHTPTIQRAAFHLQHVAHRYHRSAATILADRDGVDLTGAQADVEGHLSDAAEIIASRLDGEQSPDL